MDGAAESGERAANEVLYTMFKNDDTVQVDYQKTYYYQSAVSKNIKAADVNSKKFLSFSNLAKLAVKCSVVFGVSYFISKRFNFSAKYQLSKIF